LRRTPVVAVPWIDVRNDLAAEITAANQRR
jgi:hypothetical protein